jgi:MYXO-CTERM domain-containing protein
MHPFLSRFLIAFFVCVKNQRVPKKGFFLFFELFQTDGASWTWTFAVVGGALLLRRRRRRVQKRQKVVQILVVAIN